MLCVIYSLFKLIVISDGGGWETIELFSDSLDGLLEEHVKDANITLMYVPTVRLHELS